MRWALFIVAAIVSAAWTLGANQPARKDLPFGPGDLVRFRDGKSSFDRYRVMEVDDAYAIIEIGGVWRAYKLESLELAD